MILHLLRDPAVDDTIIGHLSIDGVFACYTLEGAAVAIPLGEYRVSITRSQRFQQMLPIVIGVPGRSGIRIHAGNTDHDTEGCILLGLSKVSDQMIGQSRVALTQVQERIAEALARGQDVYLDIDDAPHTPPHLVA